MAEITQHWEPHKAYIAGDLIWENDGEAFECINGGRSGDKKPAFPVNSRVVIAEGALMWRGYPRKNTKK